MHYKTCPCGCFECRKYSLKLSCKSINPSTSVYIMHEIFANTPEKANHYWQLMKLEYRRKKHLHQSI